MNLSEKSVVSLVFILLLCSSMPCFSIHRCKPDERPDDKPNCNENEEEIYKSQCAASILSDLFKPCHSLIPPASMTCASMMACSRLCAITLMLMPRPVIALESRSAGETAPSVVSERERGKKRLGDVLRMLC